MVPNSAVNICRWLSNEGFNQALIRCYYNNFELWVFLINVLRELVYNMLFKKMTGKEKTTKFFYNFVIFPINICIKTFIKKFINKLIQFFLFTKKKRRFACVIIILRLMVHYYLDFLVSLIGTISALQGVPLLFLISTIFAYYEIWFNTST